MPLISITSLCSCMCRIARELNLSSSQQSYESYIILLGRIVVGLAKSLNHGGFTFGSISLLSISKRFRSSLKKWLETGNRAWKASGTHGYLCEETSSKFILHCFDWDTGAGRDRPQNRRYFCAVRAGTVKQNWGLEWRWPPSWQALVIFLKRFFLRPRKQTGACYAG